MQNNFVYNGHMWNFISLLQKVFKWELIKNTLIFFNRIIPYDSHHVSFKCTFITALARTCMAIILMTTDSTWLSWIDWIMHSYCGFFHFSCHVALNIIKTSIYFTYTICKIRLFHNKTVLPIYIIKSEWKCETKKSNCKIKETLCSKLNTNWLIFYIFNQTNATIFIIQVIKKM